MQIVWAALCFCFCFWFTVQGLAATNKIVLSVWTKVLLVQISISSLFHYIIALLRNNNCLSFHCRAFGTFSMEIAMSLTFGIQFGTQDKQFRKALVRAVSYGRSGLLSYFASMQCQIVMDCECTRTFVCVSGDRVNVRPHCITIHSAANVQTLDFVFLVILADNK